MSKPTSRLVIAALDDLTQEFADAGHEDLAELTDETLKGYDDAVRNIAEVRAGQRRRGRPRIGRTIELTLPIDDIAWLDQRAEQLGLSRSEVLRELVKWWREKL